MYVLLLEYSFFLLLTTSDYVSIAVVVGLQLQLNSQSYIIEIRLLLATNTRTGTIKRNKSDVYANMYAFINFTVSTQACGASLCAYSKRKTYKYRNTHTYPNQESY